MLITLDEIETLLNETISEHKANGDGKWKRWKPREKNADIKMKFHRKGDELNVKSRYSRGKNKEFLYDFSWVEWGEDENHGAEKFLKKVHLVMELEFSDQKMGNGTRGNVMYDFNKLLQSDAEIKVMGFQMKTQEEVSAGIARMKRAISHYKPSGSFLLFGWAWKDGGKKFIFQRCP